METDLETFGKMLDLQSPFSGWRVDIREEGRSGAVVYREAAGSLSFYWEFGGGNTLAIIDVGDEATWQEKHPWTAGRRAEILQRVSDEVIRQRAPANRAEIDDRRGCIYIR